MNTIKFTDFINNSTQDNAPDFLSGIKNGKTVKSHFVSITIINKEIPAGAIDSSNTVFTIANTLVAGSDYVFYNGQLQTNGTDYAVSGQTFTFTTAPETGSKLVITYTKA